MKRTALSAALVGWLVAGGSAAQAQETLGLAPPEQAAMNDSFQYALEYSPTNQAAEWVNPDTGRSGAVIPVQTFETAQGQPCREFITTIIIGGQEEQGYGTACRQPDGSWEMVSDEPLPDRSPLPVQRREVYVYEPPPRYYAYPSGFYGPYPIYLSFSYVYRSGRSYWGRYYLDGPIFRHRHPRHLRYRSWVGPRVYRHYRPPRAVEVRNWRSYPRNRWPDPDRRWDRRRDRDRDRGWDRNRGRGGDRDRDRGRDRDRDRDRGRGRR